MTDEGKKYDLIASGFAKMRDSFNTEQKYIDLLIDNLKPGSEILDVGCGSGFPIVSYLIDRGFQVTGVDSSSELLKIAAQNCPTMKAILGDVRTVEINQKFDALVEWWCLFHIPKEDHGKMIARFASWLKKGGVLEFTSGDSEFHMSDSTMLNQELNFYGLHPDLYEKHLKENRFKLVLKENDQEQHLYHCRWGIEELYKISKEFINIEDFHSKTDRGVKQELYAQVLLITIARIFEL